LSAEIVSSSSLILRWEIGNGIRRLVFCKETQIDIAIPVDSVTYLPDSEFGFGEELGSTGWYCVYNGRGDSTIISGLNYNTNYSYQVIEYMGDIGSEVYFSNLVVGNPGIFSTGLFTEQTTITLDNADFNDFAWADYNNDGYTDLFIPSLASKLFKNNGDNTFSEDLNTNFPDYRYGSCAWGDYDNDGDLDIILTGATGSNPNYNPISSIYRNDGGGLFSEQSSIVIEPLYYSDVDWGDYNADGYLDILIMGASGDDSNVMPLTKVYLNNGDNSFTEHTESVLEGVCKGSAQWVDVDSDGDLDIHISGSNANDNYNESTNLIYKNNSGVFSYWATNLPPLRSSETDWGDYDHDGDLDVVMTRPGSVYAYENTGTSNFINILSDGYGYSSEGDVIWGDYDNDGYLDILFGNFGSAAIIYRNIESSGFEIYNDGSFKFTSVQEMNWCDYDNDGDIDMLVYPWGGVVTLYRNNLIMESGAFAVNTSAEAPTGIKSISSPTGLSLQWSPVQTDESPSNSLSYNISIGTSPDTANITPPHSDSTGFRLISGLGNASVDSSYSITNLETGKYYWQVQAVDMAFKGGQWSAIDSFEVKHLQPFFSFDTVCFESTSHFLDQSVATDEIISWTWDFGDGVYSTDQNPTHIFTNFGTHQVKLLVQTNEFSDSITQDVIVKPKPTTAFIADVVCQGTSTDFINSTTLNGTTITNWYWDFGDGAFSTLQDPPAHGYLVTGDYNVKLAAYADNGCADSIENTATVAEIPTSNIAAGGSPEFCEGESVKLSVFQSSSFNYQWKIGGVPVAGADSSVYYAIGTGDYTVSVTNQIGGCNSESATPVSVLVSATPPQPLIQTSTPTTFCAGDSVIISVTDNVDYSYQWKLNGGAVGSDTSIFVAKESGIYTLEVSNSTGCTSLSTNSIVVVVNPVPSTVSVSANGQTDFCDGGSVELSVPDDPLMDYQWMDGDISLGGETSSIYTATSTGNYKLVITNSDACFIQTQSKAVNVSPTPTVPTISTVGAETFCAGDSVILSVSDNPDLTYQWLLGGG
ncbi:MAG: VCBS repeat-containing protein, partial [Bacteroidales bacterium]|nr:VCBS repeat-containing protein [Bacteroidales bacterium]